jgi:hypothetical protein
VLPPNRAAPPASAKRRARNNVTIEEVVAPVMLPIAYGLAVAATLLMIWHVARCYPLAPKRVPLGIGYDGRARAFAPKPLLWLAPAILAVMVAFLTVVVVAIEPPRADQRALVATVFVAVAEIAWLVAWMIDRQIELARKITYRIAPGRLFRALFPLLATIVVLIVIAVRP